MSKADPAPNDEDAFDYPSAEELQADLPEDYDGLLSRFNDVMLHYEEQQLEFMSMQDEFKELKKTNTHNST